MNEDAQRVPDLPDEPDPWHWDNWNPGDGESIAGKVIERESARSERFQKDFEILVLENGSGETTRVPGARAHLAALIDEYDPQVGDYVAIRHWDPAPGERAHRYAMRVTKEGDDVPF
jgi:hypothetical protein